jgi:hypothetical protein
LTGRQQGSRRKTIDAWREREAIQELIRLKGGTRLICEVVERGDEITFRLQRDRITGV